MPRNLSRPARLVYLTATLLADDLGEVVGGQPRLAEVSGYKRQRLIAVLDECEAEKLIVRMGFTSHQRVFVSRLVESACVTCGDAVNGLRGARRCATCLQGDRSDRAWKPTAIRIAALGRLAGHSDEKIAYSAHVKTGQRLLSHGGEGQGTGSGKGEGIINFYVAEGIMPESMLRLEAGRGSSIGEGVDD